MNSLRAIARKPSPAMEDGERTHVQRDQITPSRARTQHAAYCAALEGAGAAVTVLEAADNLPDCAFVEDIAVVLPELSLVCRPGAASRRPEVAQLVPHLPDDRPLVHLAAGALDGGDVLVVGRRVFVGISSRTSRAGASALGEALEPLGYTVTGVPVQGSLHLKTAVTALSAGLLVVNPAWVDVAAFEGFDLVEVDAKEPFAANTLTVGETLLVQGDCPRTFEALVARGFAPVGLDIREFGKAEAGLTCMSLIIPPPA